MMAKRQMAPPTGPDGRTLRKGNTVGEASSPRKRLSYPNRLLTNRCNKSCDWLGPGTVKSSQLNTAQLIQQDDVNLLTNPIAQVSSDILKASGYTHQFKKLLSSGTRTRHDSSTCARLPIGSEGMCKQHSLDERCNGELQPTDLGLRSVAFDKAKSLEWNLADDVSPKRNKTCTLQQQQMTPSATHRQVRRRQSGYGISITTESQAKMRCKMRKVYFVKRNKNCDFSLALAIVGLAFVVMDQELTANRWIGKQSLLSLLLRSFCVTSTLMLILSLINYHRIEVKIALIDSGAEDWRVALTTDRIIKLFIEIAICAVCPFPGSGSISWPYIHERQIATKTVPLDVLLSVPMFLRAYLLCRFMVLHSRQFQDAATRSIAALNRISMDFRFVIKTMMADHPMTVLVIFTASYWICMSWMFTQCERYNEGYTGSTEMVYSNSLWFIMVTFMSIGYGDVVPTSYCGRFLSITTGIVGAGVSSALIAVISRKLELSRAEKHVNNFMADSKLTNARKNAAASVLQHTWFIHKYQQRNGQKGDELRLRQHQRRFLNAINDFRRIKWDQRKLQDKGNLLLDVGKLHTEMHETLWEMHRTQESFSGMIEVLTKRIVELQNAVVTFTQSQNQPTDPSLANTVFPSNCAKGNGQLKVPQSVGGMAAFPSVGQTISAFAFSDSSPQMQMFSAHPPLHSKHFPRQNDTQMTLQSSDDPFLSISNAASNLTLTNSCSSPCLQKPANNRQNEGQRQQQNCTERSPLMGEEMA